MEIIYIVYRVTFIINIFESMLFTMGPKSCFQFNFLKFNENQLRDFVKHYLY